MVIIGGEYLPAWLGCVLNHKLPILISRIVRSLCIVLAVGLPLSAGTAAPVQVNLPAATNARITSLPVKNKHSAAAAAVRVAPRHILIKLDGQADVPRFLLHARQLGLQKRGRIYGSSWYTMSLPANASPRAVTARARSLPGVVMTSVDPLVEIDQIPPRDPLYIDDDDPSAKGCDPIEEVCDPLQLVDQWGMFKVEAETAWNVTVGDGSVVIAVIDSGVDTDHDDLVGNIWTNPAEIEGNGIDDDGNGFIDDIHGADFVGDNVGNPLTDDVASEDPNPDIPDGGIWVNDATAFPYGIRFIGDPAVGDAVDNNFDFIPDVGVFHGTFVASVAAAMTDNINPATSEFEGIAGACWNCKIMPVRMVNAEGNGYASDAASAIYYATDMGADILNLSWGFNLESLDAAGLAEVAVVTDAINHAVANGVIVVASAGNSGTEALRFPASMANTIAVGSSNWLDLRSEFSTFAVPGEVPDNGIDDDGNGQIDDALDVVAPGESIWSGYVYSAFDALQSQLLGDPSVVPGLDAYGNSNGTSFSAPLVSGYLGLLLSRFPGASPNEIRQALRSYAIDLTDPEGTGANLTGYDAYSGFGRLRMWIPNDLSDPPPPPPPPPPPGPVIDLTVGTIDTGMYGHNYGSSQHATSLFATFQGDGTTAYQLQVSGYDIDSGVEVSVYVNDTFFAHLTPGPNNALNIGDVLTLDPLLLPAGENIIEFRQGTAGAIWGVTNLGVMTPPPPPPPPPVIALTVDVIDTGQYGNNYGTDLHETSLIATFTGDGSSTYYLTVDGFDIDYEDELAVYVNGVLLGYLATGANLGLNGGDVFTLDPALLVAGENTIEFRVKTVGWKWGVTNFGVMTSAVPDPPPPVIALTVGVVDAGEYGHNYGTSQHETTVVATFTGDGVTAYRLLVTGYDIDSAAEVAVYANDNFVANLIAGPDNGLNMGDVFILDPSLLVSGENTIEFRQSTAGTTWGVTGLAVMLPLPPAIALEIDVIDTGQYGSQYGTDQHESVLLATFTGDGSTTYYLHVTGFDIDFPDELAVYINGTFLDWLAVGPNVSLNAGDTFELAPALLVAGENMVEFRVKTVGWKWGVTNLGVLTTETVQPPVVELGINTVDTGQYGHEYGTDEHLSSLFATFTGDGVSTYDLQVSGYDIDYADELAVYINGVFLDYLSTGPNLALNAGDVFSLAPTLLVAGENAIEFRVKTTGWKWGVTNIVVLGPPPPPPDQDGDGLSDSLEASLGTDPLNADTDNDGLTDYDEVNRDGDPTNYNSLVDLNPLVADSDGDQFKDGMEIAAGYDPLDGTDFPVWGDLDDSRSVDAADILIATRAVMGLLTLDSGQMARGDIGPVISGSPAPDGDFNTGDVLLIERLALGLVSY
jgi:subtilisin family serine protease